MRANNPDRAWAIFGLALAGAVALPLAAVVWKAFAAEGGFWGHLAATVLPRYVANTLWIVLGVGAGTIAGGVGAAWLVSLCRFPGRRIFEWALLLPLAVPAYVVAYAYAGLFDAAGPVHTSLRQWLGAEGALSWYPNIRSLAALTDSMMPLWSMVMMASDAVFRMARRRCSRSCSACSAFLRSDRSTMTA